MERHLTGKGNVEQVCRGWIGAEAGAARHDMRVAVGEDNDFAGFDGNRLPTDNAGKTPAGGHHMIGNQMVGARKNSRQDRSRCRRPDSPWVLSLDVKERRAVSRTVFNKLDRASSAIR